MAEILSNPKLEDSVSIKTPEMPNLDIDVNEISMKNLPKFIGHKVSKLDFQENYGIGIVGIINKDGNCIIKPDNDVTLKKDDIIIVMGETKEFTLFKKEFKI